MANPITIYQAKTHFSKLVKRAQAGETIYIGSYGKAEVILAPIPKHQKVIIGVWDSKAQPNAYNDSDLIAGNNDVINSINADDTLLGAK